ncbi:hypothetical protein BPTFM16_02628 [Altererythrobacter insulae]|nr:hypothetical protein BPTFM16_02628 [Altererythrobacter insulae]
MSGLGSMLAVQIPIYRCASNRATIRAVRRTFSKRDEDLSWQLTAKPKSLRLLLT